MKKTFYYVDNDSDDLAVFLYTASSLKVAVRLFNTAEQIIDSVHRNPPDLGALLIDLNLPTVNGYEIIEQLSAIKTLAVPIIAFTTASNNSSIERAKKAGATCYIVKPQSIARLKKVITFIMECDWKTFDSEKQFYYDA